jgi:hypothetical protein
MRWPSTEFVFEGLYGAGQGGLRYVASFGRPGQIQRLADRQEVSDVVHFQGAGLAAVTYHNASI